MVKVVYLLALLSLASAYPAKDFTRDPEEVGGYFEGDIVLDDDEQTDGLIQTFNGLTDKAKRWPNKLVIYKISSDFDSLHREYILKAITTIEEETCVRFQEADDSSEFYINITANDNGCSSQVGYQRSVQRMNLQIFPLGEGCFRMGSILHEFLHTLGFYHQQSASNRDDFITIVEENIEPGLEHNFRKQKGTESFGLSYDYNSVLHYSSVAFSKNGEKTIQTKDARAVIGQRVGLSDRDIEKINTMYLCPMQI